jgi:hypothetical protein
MALPGAKLFIDFGAAFAAVAKDFVFSALLGGGLFAALALRPDGTLTGDAATAFGKVELEKADDLIGSDRLLASADEPAAAPKAAAPEAAEEKELVEA